MAEPDAQIKESIRKLLESLGVQVEDIPEANVKTPDFFLDKGKPNASLLEVKTKEDDPADLLAISTELDAGGVVERSKPTTRWNRVDDIISSGVKQLQEKDPSHLVPHFIWFHCAGRDAELYALRLASTLYGSQNLISMQMKDMVTCYYFWNSAFFRHKEFLDGAVISQGDELQFHLNDQSAYLAAAQNSSLAQALQEGMFYPSKYQADTGILINDSTGPRKDEKDILAYLRAKYALKHLVTVDLQQHSGMIRMTEEA